MRFFFCLLWLKKCEKTEQEEKGNLKVVALYAKIKLSMLRSNRRKTTKRKEVIFMMNKNVKRVISTLLCAVLAASMLSGCGTDKKTKPGEQVSITIGNWPTESKAQALEAMNQLKDEFEAANPDIKIIPDTSNYNSEGFMLAAAAGTL